MFGTRLTDTRKSRRRVDDAGSPFPPSRSKHQPYPGQFRHPDERFRFGSIMGRGPGNRSRKALKRPKGNPAVRFTANGDALAKADHTKAVQM